MEFNHVICGGTFDHLHDGHKKLLRSCFEGGKNITIGITSGAMVRHKSFFCSIQSYAIRRRNILNFAVQNKKKVKIVKLHDIFGPTIKKNTFDALFITKDTEKGAEMIQKRRKEIGMKPLSIKTVSLVYDENGEKISSERVRQGIITREGKSYQSFLISKGVFILPKSLRRVLRHPLGRIFSSFLQFPAKYTIVTPEVYEFGGCPMHISIGDVITGELQKTRITPIISIIDGKTQRKALNDAELKNIKKKDCLYALNEKGMIQTSAIKTLNSLFDIGQHKATKQLFIEGEEDLLTLPAILLAPLGSYVWYGQLGKGAVCVHVTEKKKEKVYNLLKRFE
ncbi:MAG: pantetheine-phosphate adenylyltransferase [Microgenomates group bacterium]